MTAEEPSDEDMAEVLGEEILPSIPLPTGKGPTADIRQAVITDLTPRTEEEAALYRVKKEEGQVKGDKEGSLSSTSLDPARDEDEPETRGMVIARLPARWMRLYITELFASGSPSAARLFAKPADGGVSQSTVNKALAMEPDFAILHRQAIEAVHERVDHAVYKGATEGDEVPYVVQGVVHHYKRRSDRAAEVHYKRHGLLASQQSTLTVTHQGKVEMSHDEQLGQIMDQVAQGLFLGAGAGPVIDAEVVSDSDKNEG